jgi:lysophospholipase L1-like esterase
VLADLLRRLIAWLALSLAALAGAGAAAALLFRVQGGIARRSILAPLGDDAPSADRTYRRKLGNPLRLLMVGDSIAAGLGATKPKHTLGARLAKALAGQSGRAVQLRTAAVVGSESSMLESQLDSLPLGYRPDIAVIVVGGNDVTHRVRTARSAADLGAAITRLRSLGAEVVVATCPDLGVLRTVPQPLRSVGHRTSRRLAAAQARTALANGARPVSLGDNLGPLFRAQPEDMFAEDRFHPSSLGYRRAAKVLLPAVLEALGVPVPEG